MLQCCYSLIGLGLSACTSDAADPSGGVFFFFEILGV